MRGTLRSGVVAAVVALGCSCSFVVVRGPPSRLAPGAPLECTQSRFAPALDTAGAIVTPIAGLGSWGACSFVQTTQSWASEPQNLRCGTLLWATLAITAVYTGSAVYGFHETGECRRAVGQRPPREDAPGSAQPLPANLAPVPRTTTSGPGAK